MTWKALIVTGLILIAWRVGVSVPESEGFVPVVANRLIVDVTASELRYATAKEVFGPIGELARSIGTIEIEVKMATGNFRIFAIESPEIGCPGIIEFSGEKVFMEGQEFSVEEAEKRIGLYVETARMLETTPLLIVRPLRSMSSVKFADGLQWLVAQGLDRVIL